MRLVLILRSHGDLQRGHVGGTLDPRIHLGKLLHPHEVGVI